MGCVPAPAMPDQIVLESIAEAELTTVASDFDKANSRPVHQKYMTRCQDFQDRNYKEALRHLHKADEIIHDRPNWTRFPDN
jgi:hypothetical protein